MEARRNASAAVRHSAATVRQRTEVNARANAGAAVRHSAAAVRHRTASYRVRQCGSAYISDALLHCTHSTHFRSQMDVSASRLRAGPPGPHLSPIPPLPRGQALAVRHGHAAAVTRLIRPVEPGPLSRPPTEAAAATTATERTGR